MDTDLTLWRSLSASSEQIRHIPEQLYNERWKSGIRRESWRSVGLVAGWAISLWLITLPQISLRTLGGFLAGVCGTLGGYCLAKLWRFRVDLAEIFEMSVDVAFARRCDRHRFTQLIHDAAIRLVPCSSPSLTRVLNDMEYGLGSLPPAAALHDALFECGVRKYLDGRTDGGADVARMLATSAAVETLDELARTVNRISTRRPVREAL